jgi:hypothetical protein
MRRQVKVIMRVYELNVLVGDQVIDMYAKCQGMADTQLSWVLYFFNSGSPHLHESSSCPSQPLTCDRVLY